jgi:hypothetical protein
VRILYINPPRYDYLAATLTEGLLELGCEVRASEAANYAEKLADADIPTYAEAADLIIVGPNGLVRAGLVEGLVNPRIVHVDGGDLQALAPQESIRFKIVFKRELNRRYPDPAASFLFPLPMAAERRYFSASAPQRDIMVSFVANMITNTLRESVHRRLLNLNHPQVITGTTGERAYDQAAPRGLPIETPQYRELLHRSVISVNVPGAGYDCARFWEILAARAMLFSFEPDIVIPDGFTDGVDYVAFRSLDEFDEKLGYYAGRLDLVHEIAERGHQRLLAHHTSRARAAYFLQIVRAHIDRPGHCAEWFRKPL